MGEIFYAKIAGVEGFEREVAIKKMLPHLSADRSFIDMMVKEAKLTVLLNHPNIVQVFDLGRDGNEYYIAMEYVPGTNVGQMLELCHKNRVFLPVEVAVYVTSQVLRGLSYAHQLHGPDGEPMNLLHRDITPQNILVTPQAWVKITDFGIAKARNEISTTSPGMIKGKLGYIAPEQIAGGEATQSVDIFCAGILLWEMLATRRLFKGADEIDTFRLINECRVPRLSTVRDDVSDELESVVARALAQTPENRFQSSEEYYDALNRAIFPRTIDDLATATRRYFQEHPEFFEGVITADSAGLDDGATIQIDTPETLTEDLPLITEILDARRSQRDSQPIGPSAPPRAWPWGAIAALLLLLPLAGGGVAWWLNQAPAAPQAEPLSQEEVQLAVTAARNSILECYSQNPGSLRGLESVSASITVASTGGIAKIALEPLNLGDAGPCIEEAIRAIQMREHGAPRFDTTVSLPNPADVLDAETPEPEPKPKVTTAKRASVRPLTPQDIRRGVQDRQRGIARCLQKYQESSNGSVPAAITTTMVVAGSGRVTGATFEPTPPPDVSACLAKQFTKIRYHRQPKDGLKVKFPLTIKLYSNER